MLVNLRKRERTPFFCLFASLTTTDHNIFTYIFLKEGRKEGKGRKRKGERKRGKLSLPLLPFSAGKACSQNLTEGANDKNF